METYTRVSVVDPDESKGNYLDRMVTESTDSTRVLEFDLKECSALVVLDDFPLVAGCCMYIGVATIQSTALFYLGGAPENFFIGGHWLPPISSHHRVNVVKAISIVVSAFKLGNEYVGALQVSRAARLQYNSGVWSRGVCGFCAAFVQYLVATFVLFVAVHMVLAGQSASECLLRVLSVWIVVDVDNLAARCIELWKPMLYRVMVQKPVWQRFYVDRIFFIVLPLMLLCVELIGAVWVGTLPLSFFKYGVVSNENQPLMLNSFVDVCCPPVLIEQAADDAKYSVFFLAPAEAGDLIVFWEAIMSNLVPRTPSSLQVMEGIDADANTVSFHGSVIAKPVQARFWLQRHGISDSVYERLQRDMHLYTHNLAYEATFELKDLMQVGATYYTFATAKNKHSQALAEEPVVSAPLFTSECAMHCRSCALSGPGRCDECLEGARLTHWGVCRRCPEHCWRCEETDGRCDPASCASGFGNDKNGLCVPCEAEHCDECDPSRSVGRQCKICQTNFGLNETGACSPCAHEKCFCKHAGECDSCAVGFGLTRNGSCDSCKNGCSDCSDQLRCIGCLERYAEDADGSCGRCPPNCKNCTVAGPGACDECDTGHGYDSRLHRCIKCHDSRCGRCNGANPGVCELCKDSFGVTKEGNCVSCGQNCFRCAQADLCKECDEGFGLNDDGICWSCADRCASCEKAGPERCDVCLSGFLLDNVSKTCFARRDHVNVTSGLRGIAYAGSEI